MNLHRSRRLSALVTPNGIHLVDYRSGARGWQIQGYASESASFDDADAALDALAEMVEAYGGRGGRVSVAISGLGTCYHILSLPPAEREVLRPVVERELRRFYPSVFEQGRELLIEFEPMDGEVPGEPRELLATAIPRGLVTGLIERFDARRVVLDHVTILPRVLDRLFETFAHSEDALALLLLTPGAPLLGFFFEGRLRLYAEPPVRTMDPTAALRAIADHVERGSIFLRQQFQGVTIERLLVAGPPAAVAGLAEILRLPVQRFDTYGDAPGALAALGAALDGDDERGFNLLPAPLRPPTPAQRWMRVASALAAGLLIVAGSWWTARALQAESRAEGVARQYDLRVASTQSQLTAILPRVEQRQNHVARVQLADSLVAGRAELLDILWAVGLSQRSIEVRELTLDYAGDGWAGTLRGRALTPSSGEASRAVQALLAELQRSLSTSRVDLTSYGLADPESDEEVIDFAAPVAVDFEISFIVGEPGDI